MFGIPQGWILVSLLLYTYICDIFYDSDDLDFVNFADENTPYSCLSTWYLFLNSLKEVLIKYLIGLKEFFLTLFRMGFLGAAHRWGGFLAPFLKSVIISYNDETWHSYTLPKEDQKNI